MRETYTVVVQKEISAKDLSDIFKTIVDHASWLEAYDYELKHEDVPGQNSKRLVGILLKTKQPTKGIYKKKAIHTQIGFFRLAEAIIAWNSDWKKCGLTCPYYFDLDDWSPMDAVRLMQIAVFDKIVY